KKYLFTNLILSTGVLAFAYPFLSSDIFNYMFDAKIISFYHQSPYAHKALDYPNDDWIRFMRWVHRYSPYGPLWLGLSLIPTIIGFGKFVTTLFAFKLFIGIFHITSSYLVYRITSITDKNNALLKTALYAMNPIFFIEGVINAHNDVVVACLMLTTILLALNNKKFLSYGVLLLGAFIKYVSILTLPFFMFFFNLDKNKSFKKLIYLNILTMAAFTFIFSTTGIKVPFVSTSGLQIQFQPWYLFWTLPLTVLISNLQIGILVIVLSISALLRYVPYIYNGDWSQPGTIDFMRNITVIPTITVAIIILAKKCLSKIS
ncbi:hypothetical protein HY024_05205, partial [Candidatus Curtissbacteria bacterium]|nr:hypothetical protein [Candidatus Curtissbacteria bacterium]